LQGKIVKEITI